MNFDWAQTFYIDPSLVQNAFQINVTKVVLYFKQKPNITGNKSGIYAPGVEVRICPTINGIPLVSVVSPLARKEYNGINGSLSSLTPTTFEFTVPVSVRSGQEYAIVVKFDGNEDFILWTNVQGELLLDENGNQTTVISPGATGQYIGKLFSFISETFEDPIVPVTNADLASVIVVPSTSTQTELDQVTPEIEYLLSAWRPLNNSDLKFQVEVARYSHQGSPVHSNNDILTNNFIEIVYSNNIQILANNTIRLASQAHPVEFIEFDKKTSSTEDLRYGDSVFEYQPYFPGGRHSANCANVAVAQGSIFVVTPNNYTLPNGSTFIWDDVYNFSASIPEYIVVVSENHFGANAHAVNVRRVERGLDNTNFAVTEPFTFTNASAKFFKSPVGRIYSKSRPYISGRLTDIFSLVDSNANTTCRFVNNYISNVTINDIGAGYNNSDYVRILGFENVTNEVLGGYEARANLVTYANGSLQFVYLSNTGAGFVNTGAITYLIVNSTNQNSVGTGGNLSFITNAVLFTETGNMNTYFSQCEVINLEAQSLLPAISIDNPPGTVYSLKFKSLYKTSTSANTLSGKKHFIDTTESAVELDVKNGTFHYFPTTKRPTIVSRSNQFVIGYANGFIPNSSILGGFASNTAVFLIDMYSNNDFASVSMNPSDIASYYSKYSINNDYTRENQNYGNCYAKHISTKISFANGQFAEDLIVYITAYRPQGTDIKVLARMHNSHDSEAFDDKDWTLLEQTDGIDVFSSLTNPSDRVEMTYNLRLYPNTNPTDPNTSVLNANTVLQGVVTTELNNTTIVGVGTAFTSNLATGDLIKLYQPLFPNADYMVAVVNTITNSTILVLNEPVTNNSLVASGMKIERIQYPLQVFKNLINDNVARYYSSTKVAFDTFDTFQLKVLLLSPDDFIVPKVDDIRAIGVTS
jgi:hypothetical protein